MFADDTSITMKSHNNTQLQWELNTVMTQINEWFQDNLITLNLNKTDLMQFSNKSSYNHDIQIEIQKNQYYLNKLNQIFRISK